MREVLQRRHLECRQEGSLSWRTLLCSRSRMWQSTVGGPMEGDGVKQSKYSSTTHSFHEGHHKIWSEDTNIFHGRKELLCTRIPPSRNTDAKKALHLHEKERQRDTENAGQANPIQEIPEIERGHTQICSSFKLPSFQRDDALRVSNHRTQCCAQ